MPKQVDHAQRRSAIAEALFRVAERQGLLGVSVRHVAAEAGVSAGMVQHYFRTKDEMMAFALEAIGERARVRIEAKAGVFATASPGEAVRALLVEMLPLDEERRRESHVAVALGAYAAVHTWVADGQRENAAALEGFLAAQVRAAQEAGTASADLDPERAATALSALMEGLALTSVVSRRAPEETEAVLDAHLRALFGRSPM